MSTYYYEHNQILPQRWTQPVARTNAGWLVALVVLLLLLGLGYEFYWVPQRTESLARAATVYIHDEKGEASGIVIDPKGLILTNRHVVEGATKFEVIVNSGTPAFHKYEARLLKKSPGAFTLEGEHSNTSEVPSDWAVLQIEPEVSPPLTAVPIEMGPPPEDEPVAVLGFPSGKATSVNDYGGPQVSYSTGVIASLKKDNGGHLVAIAHTAVTAPGSSGGPVIYRGKLIGMTCGKIGDQNWAVPIAALKDQVFDAQGQLIK
jgi:S1-C subfamily serine protease